MKPVKAAGCIPPQHPALPGHFPGTPVVPGVVLLEEVVRAAQHALGTALELDAIPDAKFHAPLSPGEEFLSALEPVDAMSVTFLVTRGDTRIASGTMRFRMRAGTS